MITKGFTGLTWKEIRENIGEETILSYYFNVIKLPCVINSPLRQDNHPSFWLKYSKDRIVYSDFSTGEYGSLLTLLKKYFNLSGLEVINKIYTDLHLDNSFKILNHSISKTKISKFQSKNNFKIKFRVKHWGKKDLEFWNSFGITKEWLKFGLIYPISHIFINKGNLEYTIPADEYAYVYIENKDNNTSIKVYQPFSKYYKWINTHDLSVWDLWDKLPSTGDKLIITSSRKDSLCVWANTGIPCTNLQAESYLPKEHVIQELKARFKDIYVLYDNDFTKEHNWGRQFGERICSLYNLKQIEIPEIFSSKDPSDLYKNHGSLVLLETINKLIN